MAPSGPVRRNGILTSKPSAQSTSSMTRTSSPTSSTTSPLLLSSLEMLLLSVYPITLLLGSLFSLLDPSARKAPYNPVLQSHPPAYAPSYFALKRNLLNAYFVKINWFWVSLAYVAFLFLHKVNGPRGLVLTPRRLRGLVRYAIATVWWIGVTQWLFGPPLIDRGFRITGGACELASHYEGSGGKREFVTSQACKIAGGTWKGGHDISGHVFILVLGSAFLAMEVLPMFLGKRGMRDERVVKRRDGGFERMEIEMSDGGDEIGEGGGILSRIGVWMPIVVAGLSWWMLLMTAAYFHTWFEKLTGLLVAFFALFVVFFMPRAIIAMRDIVGMPGV
ncbi:MAG: hypothetical protein Q9217_004314 [Psora testacea]